MQKFDFGVSKVRRENVTHGTGKFGEPKFAEQDMALPKPTGSLNCYTKMLRLVPSYSGDPDMYSRSLGLFYYGFSLFSLLPKSKY